MADILTDPVDLLWFLRGDLDHAGGGDLTNGLREGPRDVQR
jgi:hypothetical protein